MTVRAKFKVTGVAKTPDGFDIMLRPVTSGSPENEAFYKYTPWGEIRLGTVNEEAAKEFVVGEERYVDFVDPAAIERGIRAALKVQQVQEPGREVLVRPNVEIRADALGSGGASHQYHVTVSHLDVAKELPAMTRGLILFQAGPIKENGVNGITNEVLLEIVADRLRCFQAGDFACEENAEALAGVEAALKALYDRTEKRVARGVEGTSVK